MRALRKWMKATNGREIERLATMSGTSPQYLYMLAEGLRVATSAMAAQIEKASFKINKIAKLPKLYRGDICPTCAECPYYKKCKE